jgi:hypothetical protein
MSNAFGETPLGLRAEIMNLASILSRPLTLRTPPFQRPYTWGIKEVSQLIDDLLAAFARRATFYFVGQIVFVRDGLHYADISDGQQRLTTLTMLLAYARDQLPGHSQQIQTLITATGGAGRLRLKQSDAAFFEHYVQKPGGMRELAALESAATDAQECMIIAAREIEFALSDRDPRTLWDFINYIARFATFNVVDADEPGGAATVFATMNDRGQSLSGSDILKGALLGAKGLSSEDVTEGAKIWEELEDRAGREAFARLLRYVPPLVTGDAIISPGDVAALVQTIANKVGIRQFLREWLPAHGEALLELCHASVAAGEASTDINRRVRCLQLLEPETWEPLAIAYLARRGEEREKARDFFLAYERFTAACLLGAVDSKTRRNRMERAWKNLADDRALDAAFELTGRMRDLLRKRVAHSSKRDRYRRYLVLRVNAALGEVLRYYDDASVEHVLPMRASNWWRALFPDEKRYAYYANLLGNFVLVTDKQNNDAENKPYPEKRDIYFGRDEPERALLRDIKPLLEWTPPVLEERHERLVAAIGRDWELR